MDWVKPKHRANRAKDETLGDADNQSAIQWLEKLCVDNVAMLQSSLPVETKKSKHKPSDFPIHQYLQAMLWGIGNWEVAKPAHREFLQDLVDAFGKEPFGYSLDSHLRKTKRSKQTQVVPDEIRAQQVAQATKIGKWITQQLPKSSYDPYVALTATGWLYALPEVGRDIPPALWLEVLQSTLTQVDRAWEQGPSEGLFPWVIWACEVPLALAKQMSHLGGKDRIVSETLNRLALLIEQTAEDPQNLLAFGAQDLRAFVASLIRSRWAADNVGARKWYPPQRRGLAKLQSIMLHLTDPTGHAMLDQTDASRYEPEFWTSLMNLCMEHKKVQLATAVALPDEIGKEQGFKPAKLRKDKTNDARLPKPSHYWEKNQVVSMRRNWRKKDCQLAVDFSRDSIWLDLCDEAGNRILSGDWDIGLEYRGKPVDVDVAWNEVCWFSDDDVDYLELECDLEGTCTIYRQVMLMRHEGMVYMADSLLGNPEDLKADWKTTSTWTLDAATSFVPEAKSNEGRIERHFHDESTGEDRSETVALLLPLSLPEWRRGSNQGSLSGQDGKVTLEARTTRTRLLSSMLLAVGPKSRSPKFTWRALTVAENLHKVSDDIAQGCRVQIDDDQWVFYRSLAPCTRRTIMGLHLGMEFYAGRFLCDDGTYEPLVEVSPE
jgi:hypothetical protein